MLWDECVGIDRGMFLLHVLTTLYMVGLIWFVQIVHYPLFGHINPQDFREYEQQHQKRTGRVVAPVMLVELGTGIYLALMIGQLLGWKGWMMTGLLGLIWASTFLIQVPLHGKLSDGSDAAVIQKLVQSNWIRTIAWSLRGGLLLYAMAL